ncbi:HECT E3 ubiquitin ligase, partial [Thraustotheca clavata]
TSVNQVHTGGLADAFLNTLCRWDLTTSANALPPSPELIIAVPSVLSAICLSSSNVDKVVKMEPLNYLLDMLVMPDYVVYNGFDALQGDVASIVGGGLDELMRHVSAFQKPAIDACTRAVKKIQSYGENNNSEAAHTALLRMAMHICDVLETLLAKTENATRFADLGGMDTLLALYSLILPSTSSFLSTVTQSQESNIALAHYPAAQGLTVATRSYASQQPTSMLTKIMKQFSQNLSLLSPSAAVGVISSVTDVAIGDLAVLDSNPQVLHAGEYLRRVSVLEWLVSLLLWSLRTAHAHSQSRRWFAEFTSATNQKIMADLFEVERSILVERTSLEVQIAGATTKEPLGLWKIGSLLLLKFSLMVRNLATRYGRTFLAVPAHHRISDESVSPIATHAQPLATSLHDMLTQTFATIESLPNPTPIGISYAGCFYIETLTALLYEGKRRTVNSLLLKMCLESNLLQKTMSFISAHALHLLDNVQNLSKQELRFFLSSFQLIKRISDFSALTNAPMTASLMAQPDTFDPTGAKLELHTLALNTLAPLWSKQEAIASLPWDGALSYLFPAIAMLLKHRLDVDKVMPEKKKKNELVLDDMVVDSLTSMGFGRPAVERALRRVEVNDVELAMEWLLANPEEDVDVPMEETPQTPPPAPIAQPKELAELYASIRNGLEQLCFNVVHQQSPQHRLVVVKSIADLLMVQCQRSETERSAVLSHINKFVLDNGLEAMASATHLLALLLHSDPPCRKVIAALKPSCIPHCLEVLTQSSTVTGPNSDDSITTILLVMDALGQEEGVLTMSMRETLLDSCIDLMRLHRCASETVGHAVWQLLVRLTREVSFAERFVSHNGVEACLSVTCRFDGYKELTSALLAHVMEYPEVLQARMEEKILQSLKKLSSRFGAPELMRISPRALLSELGIVALRNEQLFLQALKETIVVQKSESGRLYVLPTKTTKLLGQQKLLTLPIHNAAFVINLVVENLTRLWNAGDQHECCIPIFYLAHLVSLFPTCANLLLQDHMPFVSLVLSEMLPCRDLTQLMRKQPKSDSNIQDRNKLKEQTKDRVHNAHRLLLGLCTNSTESAKKVLTEVVKHIELWVSADHKNGTLALSSLHAWCALMLSILWPRDDVKEKSGLWEHAKWLLKAKINIVTILFDVLGKIDLTHPLARTTSNMVLRLLAAFTRPWVAHRLRKLPRKKSTDEAHEEVPAGSPVLEGQSATGEERPSSEFEDVHMEHEGEESDEEEGESDQEEEEDHDDEEDEEGDDEEEEEDEEEEDEDEEELNREDMEMMESDYPSRSRSDQPVHPSLLWDTLDADLAVLQEDDDHPRSAPEPSTEESSQALLHRARTIASRRFGANDLSFANEAQSIFDLFSASLGSNNRSRNAAWSQLFREFENDTNHHGEGDRENSFVLRDFDDEVDDNDIVTVPFDVLDRDTRRFRRNNHNHLYTNGIDIDVGRFGPNTSRSSRPSSGNAPAVTNSSLAGLTHPFLQTSNSTSPTELAAELYEFGGLSNSGVDRPPSRHNISSRSDFQLLSDLSLTPQLHRSNATRFPRSNHWEYDSRNPFGNRDDTIVRSTIARMEEELSALVVTAPEANEEEEEDEIATPPPPADPVSTHTAEDGDAASETASVIALTSTLGQSSLQSPADASMSVASSPVPATEEEQDSASSMADQIARAIQMSLTQLNDPNSTAPPPAPSNATSQDQLFSFTLDLPTIPPPSEQQQTQPEAVDAALQPLVCPEGMDAEVFNSLPPDMQAEIIASQQPAPAATESSGMTQLEIDIANSSYDRETLEALPADIRDEILANERREREAAAAPADISLAQEMDNASFVASLAPELREEILITSDDSFLQTLPSEVRAEAMILRERHAFRSNFRPEPATTDANGMFRRPTLRRMLTTHGTDILQTGAGRRPRNRHDNATAHAITRSGSQHAGLLLLEKEEGEIEHLNCLNNVSVQSLLKLLYMVQSVLNHRDFQNVLSNLCLYPKTRSFVQSTIMKMLKKPSSDSDFPPNSLLGCTMYRQPEEISTTIPIEVATRVLTVLVALTKQNARFVIELLSGNEYENLGFVCLINLLSEPVVYRSATNLDMLLEVLHSTAAPFVRFSPEKSKDESDAEDEAFEWIAVPSVELNAVHMERIVSVLSLDLCTSVMQTRVISILKHIATIKSNQTILLSTLVAHIKVLALSPLLPSGSSSALTSAVLASVRDERKLLRYLHTLSDVASSTEQFTEQCRLIGLDGIWDALSRSLEEARDSLGDTERGGDGMVIEGKSAGASCAMASLLTRFLPMIEAFFVVNARDAANMSLEVPVDTTMSEREAAMLSLSNDMDESKPDSKPEPTATLASIETDRDTTRLALFVEANRVLLNMLVREKPSLLDTSFAALIKIPRCRAFLDFDNKRTYFQTAMKRLRQSAMRHGGGGSSVRIPVRRDRVFEDSFYALRMRSGNELRRKLHISFTGEEGIDAGGVTREWYMILAREIFNPNYALFTSAADSPTFQPNPLSYVNKDHLIYFEFVGKVIGKAIADGQLLDAHFTRSFYKHILQLPISYSDMEAIDPEYYRNLHALLDNPIEDLCLDLAFSLEHSNFGKVDIVDLIPNGRNIPVTNDNKMEYVKLVTHHRMATGIRAQIDAFLSGLHQLVSPQLISIFNENELELLISGMPEIDIDDLKANTDYANFKPTDPVIRWFWNVLYSFSHEERALFLQFVTGTSKVPLEGFKALEGMRGTQKFNIHKAFGSSNRLPTAHTCFNQLDLPEYENEEQLKARLLLAIREGSEGFGFG